MPAELDEPPLEPPVEGNRELLPPAEVEAPPLAPPELEELLAPDEPPEDPDEDEGEDDPDDPEEPEELLEEELEEDCSAHPPISSEDTAPTIAA